MSPDEERDAPQGDAAEEEAPERTEFQEEVRAHRLEKLEQLRQRGIDPYPVRFDRDSSAAAIREEFADLAAGTDTGKVVRHRRPGDGRAPPRRPRLRRSPETRRDRSS